MLHLVEKEFKVNSGLISFQKDKIVSAILTILLSGIMVYVSTFMFVLLFRKFATYGAEIPFAIIYMFILALVSLFFATFVAKRVFFNNLDYAVTVYRPIDTFALIFAKALYLFLVLFIFEFVLFAPHYIAFGVMSKALPTYYYIVLIAIIFHTLFNLAVAMILSIGLEVISRFVKRYLILQLTITVIIAVAATFLYGSVLNLFLKLLNNSNVSYLFNDANIRQIKYISTLLYPDVFISRSLFTLNYEHVISYFLLTVGVLLLAFIVVYVVFVKVINIDGESKRKYKQKAFKPKSQRYALFKKEVILLTREASNLYNFTMLIIITPVLMYLVIVGINQAFNSGVFSVYASVLPSLISNIDILIIMLFSSLIALSGANLMKSEHKSIRIIKYLPYKVTKQVYIKMALLAAATLFTNTISLTILFIFKEITFGVYSFLLVSTILLNVALIVLSFRSEIINFRKQSNENALASFIAFLTPILVIAINLVATLLLQLKSFIPYLINFALLGILIGFIALYLRRAFPTDVENLEVIN